MKDYIENTIAPRLQGDGGWVEFISAENGVLTLLFRGECAKCGILERCTDWIADMLARDLHETVQIRALRKKPYFQDT